MPVPGIVESFDVIRRKDQVEPSSSDWTDMTTLSISTPNGLRAEMFFPFCLIKVNTRSSIDYGSGAERRFARENQASTQ
jgi:hypothetical protein